MQNTTIAAICTPAGTGAIAIIRLSGPDAFTIADRLWRGKPLAAAPSHTVHLGTIYDTSGQQIDQVVATLFRGPNSFTGEDTVEINCHGSRFIQQTILTALIDAGATPAAPGEYSRRAFMNGRIDLAQAEGIADLISAQSQSAHRLALMQTKGVYSQELERQRMALVNLAAMLELELDFSEEDVEFADRGDLRRQADEIRIHLKRLADSYSAGRVIRDGHPIAIVGAPNAGKSTLLNTLTGDDLAIVSDIPGTTRDAIQTTTTFGPHLIRFIDTAGLRETDDTIEALGIDRTYRHIARAQTIIWMLDPTVDLAPQLKALERARKNLTQGQTLIAVAGKSDLVTDTSGADLSIDSRTEAGIAPLASWLERHLERNSNSAGELTVTNARHYAALCSASESLGRTIDAIDNSLPTDLIALELRDAIHHLGLITGTITTDTLLTHLFANFCIGK